MLDVKNYLLKINKELTSVGPVLARILDISVRMYCTSIHEHTVNKKVCPA